LNLKKRENELKEIKLSKRINKRFKKFDINLTIRGGVSSEFDLQSEDKLEVENVIIGKALYQNKLNSKQYSKNIKVN